ncbi:prefoldin-like protein NDAI_0G03210 [Naumovozyma dairenensis CBS 421]|uniref:DUF3835 domain-containing protein n=1 Tax=Naumovozyma dairenensis (strain ATCC 10597 / BCRC 20456 / CBS 421 / NBRC 0211 / NRRL Y-12639) TaxID=1071378 RepID=G0WE87_NAUDC|nr:hypothetical protein NDAI_0G03210 [Naumovozyma dairenensis CBS 421]CCD26098.2 hypothetical protein NDAI_0G03210 [Naumovozyma dairenensis CBS 421]
MDNNVDPLLKSLNHTLESLQSKYDFLAQQRDHYLQIRERLFEVSERPTVSDEEKQNGVIFGDVIISDNKVFLNIGYEYYIEKSRDEVIEFISDKLRLMEEAMTTFHAKIDEANGTLQNLTTLKKFDEQTIGDEEDEDELLPSMEVREELDEEGNVITASVRPATNKNSIKDLESKLMKVVNGNANDDDYKQIHDNKEDSDEENDFVKNLKGKLSVSDKPSISEPPKMTEKYNRIDADSVYTFADLVEQLDEQDEFSDGSIHENDIKYDFESYDTANGAYSTDEDEDEDDLDISLVPGAMAQSSFMKQIMELRNSRAVSSDKEDLKEEYTQIIASDNDIVATKSVKENTEQNHKADTHKKSILKSTCKEDELSKSKRNVGFAPELNVIEVENFKEETRKQTHNFPRPQFTAFDNEEIDDDDDDDDNPADFDADLFAQLIGAQPPDEIHDKYKEIVKKEQKIEQDEIIVQEKRKRRVSRFKMDRSSTDVKTSQDVPSQDSCAKNKLNEPEPLVGDIIDKDDENEDDDEEIVVNEDIVENDLEGNDEVVKDYIIEKVIEDEIIENNNEAMLDVVAKDGDKNDLKAATQTKKGNSFFSKKMNSLRKPISSLKNSANSKIKMEELLASINDDEDNINDKEVTDDEQHVCNHSHEGNKKVTSKINEISRTDLKTIDKNESSFPKDIVDAIRKREEELEKNGKIANIDYMTLGENIDDMTKAYSLGLYDDDLEDDPGAILEKVEDFTEYNKHVEELKDEIKEFQLSNPIVEKNVNGNKEDRLAEKEVDESAMMVDVIEHDIPDDYSSDGDDSDADFGLQQEKLHESISIEYQRLKEQLLSKMESEGKVNIRWNEPQELEPIDEFGNLVKTSKFKSQRSLFN